MSGWYVPHFPVEASKHHKELAVKYAALRAACTAFNELIEAAEKSGGLSEAELKRLDFGVVLLRLGYKRIKKVLERAGAECGRRKLASIYGDHE